MMPVCDLCHGELKSQQQSSHIRQLLQEALQDLCHEGSVPTLKAGGGAAIQYLYPLGIASFLVNSSRKESADWTHTGN